MRPDLLERALPGSAEFEQEDAAGDEARTSPRGRIACPAWMMQTSSPDPRSR
jgi:hypothetical protein